MTKHTNNICRTCGRKVSRRRARHGRSLSGGVALGSSQVPQALPVSSQSIKVSLAYAAVVLLSKETLDPLNVSIHTLSGSGEKPDSSLKSIEESLN